MTSDQHHLYHASAAFNNSGFQSALVVVVDRMGSDHEELLRESESVFKVNQEYNFEPIYKSYWLYRAGGAIQDDENYNSTKELKIALPNCEIVADSGLGIVKVYETATTLMGQGSLENGKIMGLSAYGKDKKFKDLFVYGIPNDHLFTHIKIKDYRPILKEHYGHGHKLGENEILSEEGYELYADYAYQVQKQTQNEVLALVKRKVEETGINNVCMTGGYGLNVVSNENLVKNLPDVNFFFEPLADDSGNSIGAALHVYRQRTNDKKIYKLKDTFFNHIKHPIEVEGTKATSYDVAKLLDNQKVVAVFNGLAEAGPRALGNRSILFDARNPKAKDIINSIKGREWYRPVACSILKEAARDYFEMYNLEEAPYMTISFPIRKEKKQVIPGVIHVDDSCRIQTVDINIEHFYKLLKEFEKITGVPVLLNTSFNVAGKPLIETVNEAIDTFKKTSIDVLWFPEKEIILTK
jgi:carbamoyltransferase